MDTGVVAVAFFGVRGHSFEDNEYRAAHVALAIVSLSRDTTCGRSAA